MPVPFSIRLDETIKAKLEKEAQLEDRSASYLAQKAIEAFIDAREYKRELIRASYQEAQTATAFISDEAMSAWVESWDAENELPEPKPDVFK